MSGVAREVVHTLLLLVEDEVPGGFVTEAEIGTWTDEEVHEVTVWASAVHLAGSDNSVPVPALPLTLKARAAYPGTATPLDQIQDT